MGMATYTITIAANVRAYATVEVEAADEAAAQARGEELARAINAGEISPAMPDMTFSAALEAQYDSVEDCEVIDVQPA